jgi:hypothetical protein
MSARLRALRYALAIAIDRGAEATVVNVRQRRRTTPRRNVSVPDVGGEAKDDGLGAAWITPQRSEQLVDHGLNATSDRRRVLREMHHTQITAH